jgi:thiol-disulfide isomerase/thioredoxin
MKNSFILLAAAAGLASLVIGVSAGRSHIPAPMAAATARDVSPPAKSAVRAAPPGAEPKVIRFASNPQPVPPFLVRDLDGDIISTAEWHGKVTLVNFWATWCPPCREEIPQLIALVNRYKDRLQVIGISMDDTAPEAVKQFAKKMGINYPIIMGSKEIIEEYGGVPALPTSFLVNQDARVVQKHVGLFPPDVYDGEVRALLGLPVDAKIETFQDTGQIFLKNAALATDLPGVDFTGLSPEQKKAALKRMNSEGCDCGCRLTIAQCRINDTSCPVSQKLAEKILKEIHSGTPTRTTSNSSPQRPPSP